MKIITPGEIDWAGIKSALIHSAIIGLSTFATYLLAMASHHNFGEYQAVAVWVIGSVGSFLKKFFETYGVVFEA